MPSGMAARWSRGSKVKAGVYATAFAAVIIVGSLTGAQLKQDKQKEEVSDPYHHHTTITVRHFC